MFIATLYMALYQDAGIREDWYLSDWILATMAYTPQEETYWYPRGQHDACSFAAFYRVRDAWEDRRGRLPNECREMHWGVRVGTRYHADRTTLGMYNVSTKSLSVHVTEYARHGPYGNMVHEWLHAIEYCGTDTTNRVQREHLSEDLWMKQSGMESIEWQVKYGFPLIARSACAPVRAPPDKRGTYVPPPRFN